MSVFFAQRGGGSPVPRGSPTCPSLIASYLEPPTPPSSPPPPPLPGAGCEQEDQGESLRPSGLAMALRAAAHPALSGSVSRADPAQPLIDWSPGPAPLPKEVMCSIQAEFLNYRGTGTSVMCMSHRSPEFAVVFEESLAALRTALRVPLTHEIIFTHGGGHGQMAAVPLNLCPSGGRADYLVTGTWSRRAVEEASKYITVNEMCAHHQDSTSLPPREEWMLDSGASYRYICSNETVNGTEFHTMPEFDDGVPLVVDMSSDIASKPLQWERIGVAFACAPKNIGHAGLTVVIVKRELLASRVAQTICPNVLNWTTITSNGGMWNTPATFNIYTTGKVMQWILDEGGIDEMAARADRKSGAIYTLIDESEGFYTTPCSTIADRSRMNVPFVVCGGDTEATEAFLIGAYARNMVGFRTKTPFGYGNLRASFYTGTTVEQAEVLAEFMRSFMHEWAAR